MSTSNPDNSRLSLLLHGAGLIVVYSLYGLLQVSASQTVQSSSRSQSRPSTRGATKQLTHTTLHTGEDYAIFNLWSVARVWARLRAVVQLVLRAIQGQGKKRET